MAFSESNLAVTLMWEGELDDSIRRNRIAVLIAERELGAEHPRLTFLYENLGAALHFHFDLTEAETAITRGLTLAEAGLPEHAIVGTLLQDLGDVLFDAGEYTRAIAPYERALHMHEKASDDAGIGYDVGGLGKVYVALGDPLRALPLLERAVKLRATGRDTELADSQFFLGQAIVALGQGGTRGHALAVTARDTLVKSGKTPLDARNRKRIELWLEAHPR